MRTVLFIFLFFSFGSYCSANEIFKRTLKLMGSRFEITVVAPNKDKADQYIDMAVEEIKRIEKLISSWDDQSQTSLINKYAGVKAVKVDSELIELIERSIGISKLTDGAFDISYASMDKVWKYDGSMTTLPSVDEIKASIALIGYQNITIDKELSSVYLQKKGMRLGFGGIGKGYAADKAKSLLIKRGVKAGIINASGDMNTWGAQPNGKAWEVAITNPMDKNKAFALLPIENNAVVTSGNYEKYVIIDNKRYSHIIDPRTGYPSNEVISATVFAPKAELADALATATMIMGVKTSLDRINQLPNIECILIDNQGNVHQSNNIKIDTTQ